MFEKIGYEKKHMREKLNNEIFLAIMRKSAAQDCSAPPVLERI
jgi:hypothetical protein